MHVDGWPRPDHISAAASGSQVSCAIQVQESPRMYVTMFLDAPKDLLTQNRTLWVMSYRC